MIVVARHGSEAFNRRMAGELSSITADVSRVVGPALEALVLGGGYGRGEGGVVESGGVEQPYNDLDLFLFVRPGSAIRSAAVDAACRPHAERLGIHVDVSRPVRLAEVPRWPPLLMWNDLLEGHAVLAGPADVLASRTPPWLGRALPAVEATRLLLNRGAGLLWATRIARGIEPSPDPEFVRRNAFKAALGLGDALLIAHGRYASRCEGRDALLESLAADVPGQVGPDVQALHREGLAFKFRPDRGGRALWTRSDLESLGATFARVFLSIESTRHGQGWASADAYAAWTGRREDADGGPGSRLKDAVRNLRRGRLSMRTVRDPLYPDLPRLLAPASSVPGGWPAASGRWLDAWRRTL